MRHTDRYIAQVVAVRSMTDILISPPGRDWTRMYSRSSSSTIATWYCHSRPDQWEGSRMVKVEGRLAHLFVVVFHRQHKISAKRQMIVQGLARDSRSVGRDLLLLHPGRGRCRAACPLPSAHVCPCPNPCPIYDLVLSQLLYHIAAVTIDYFDTSIKLPRTGSVQLAMLKNIDTQRIASCGT